jgi:hypothetical protein
MRCSSQKRTFLHHAGMNAVFTFKLSDLIAGLTRSNQWEWHATCEAEFMSHYNADLTVEPISESDLVTSHIAIELRQTTGWAAIAGRASSRSNQWHSRCNDSK